MRSLFRLWAGFVYLIERFCFRLKQRFSRPFYSACYLILILVFFTGAKSWGQISIASLPYSPAVTNFNSYNPNTAGNFTSTLPTGWTGSSSGTASYNVQGNGSGNAGGYWGYGTAGEYSLGALRSGTPGNITYTVSFTNNSGSTITSITLGWDYEQWRYGGSNTSGWDCSGTGQIAGNAALDLKDFTGANGTAGTTGGLTTTISSFTLSSLSIANGQSFGISWVTTDPTGTDNGVSIDNFSISATGAATPTITTSTSNLTGFSYVLGLGPSTTQTFTVSGSNLTNDISLAAPTDYEISTSNSPFTATSPITFTQSGGNVSTQTIYVRLKAGLGVGTYSTSENIVCTSTGATTKNVACSGSVTATSSCGSETFINASATGSYSSGSYIGDNSTTWSYVAASEAFTNGYAITSKGLILRNLASSSAVSATVPGGIGDFTCKLRKAYTGSGSRQAQLYVNGVLKGTSATFGSASGADATITNFSVSGINISGSVTVKIVNNTGNQFTIDDVSWTCYASCSPPSQTTLVAATLPAGSTSTTINTSAGTGSNRLIIVKEATLFTSATPSGSYAANSIFGSGDAFDGGYVVYNGTGNSVTVTNLKPYTYYVIEVFEFNAAGPCYNTVSPAQGEFTTAAAAEPTNYPTLFTCGITTTSTIPLTWIDATGGTVPDGYLIIWNTTGTFTDPTDGTAVADATGSTGALNVAAGVKAAEATGLSSGVTYYFKIYPYSNSGSAIDYKTSASPPTTNCTTVATACVSEGFSAGTTPPSGGWTFNSIGGTYTTSGNYGAASPSLTMDATNDRIQTSTLASGASSLSFWIKGQSVTGSSLLVEGYIAGTWSTVINITSVPSSGTTYTYNASSSPALPSNITQFRFTYTKGLGNLAIDDIVIYCSSACASPVDISNAAGSAESSKTELSWNNSSCFDEVMVVATNSAGLTFAPTGTAYTANSVYAGNNQVMYRGTGNTFIATNLTNGTTYYFEIYTRKGSTWSAGVEVSVIPVATTVLKPGDLIFVGFDTYVATGGDDYFSIATLKDIAPGTQFMLANAVYESGQAANVSNGRWYNGNGNSAYNVASTTITYNGPGTLAQGSVICIQTSSAGNITGYKLNGVTTAKFTSDNGLNVQFSSTSADAVWLMQGNFTAAALPDAIGYYSTFSGTVLGGIQSRGTFKDLNVAADAITTRISRIHPDIKCFGISTGGASNAYYGYYSTASLHVGTQHDLIAGIADYSNNWTKGTTCACTTDGNDIPICSNTFTVSGGNSTAGKWTGTVSSDWFLCSNWDNFQVPDTTQDVTITSVATNIANIDPLSSYAPYYGSVASSKSIVIDNKTLSFAANAILNTVGDLTIQNSGLTDMTSGGTINLRGNWLNTVGTSGLTEGIGTVNLWGYATAQTVSATGGEGFYNLIINNGNGVTMSKDASISNIFTLTNGIVNTSTSPNGLLTLGTAASVGGSPGTSAFVNGPMAKNTITTAEFEYPVGKTAPSVNYRPVSIVPSTTSATTYTAEYMPGSPVPDNSNLLGALLMGIQNNEYWQMERSTSGSPSPARIKINYVNGGTGIPYWTPLDPCSNCNVAVTHLNSTHYWEFTSSSGNFNTSTPEARIYTSNGPLYSTLWDNFSFGSFGVGYADNIVLPVVLLTFDASLKNSDALLHWTIANDKDLSSFEVQYSKDGSNFISLASIGANGAGIYDYTHSSLLNGKYYYRILIKQKTGSSFLSAVKSLNIGRMISQIQEIVHQPGGRVIIPHIYSAASQKAEAGIYDAGGRLLQSQSTTLRAGSNEWNINLPTLANGIYFLTITTGDGLRHTEKWLK